MSIVLAVGMKKEYFKKPVVRTETARIRFPQRCPVCGSPATHTARIEVAAKRREYQSRSWYPFHYRYTPRRTCAAPPPTRILPIPTCEHHQFLDEDHERYRVFCLVIDGLALAFMFFAILFIGDALWRGTNVGALPVGLILFFVACLVTTYFAFRPNALQRAVRLVGFDAGIQNVLLLFENDWYRDEFMRENPMTSTLISWIVRAET